MGNPQEQNERSSLKKSELPIFGLINLLRKEKLIFLSIFFLFTATGIIAAYIIERTFVYSTTLEIGQRNGQEAIEAAPAVAVKVNESYIPKVLLEAATEKPELLDFYRSVNLKARVPKDTNLVVLEMSEKESRSELALALLDSVLDLIKEEHRRNLELYKSSAEFLIAQEQQKLKEQIDSLETTKGRLARVDKLEAVYQKQLSDTGELLTAALQNRKSAYGSAGKSESSAMTFMLIDNEIESTRQRYYEIERTLQFDLKNERASLEMQIEDIKRNITLQEASINQAKLQLDAIKETKALVPPMKSLKAKAPGPLLIVFIFAVIGGFVALFLLVIRFWSSADSYPNIREQEQ